MSGDILHKPLMMSDHAFTSGKSSFLDCLGPAPAPACVCRRLISHKVFMCCMSNISVILTLFDPRSTKPTHLEVLHIRLGHFPDGECSLHSGVPRSSSATSKRVNVRLKNRSFYSCLGILERLQYIE